MRVKIFEGENVKKLENQANDWFEENNDIVPINVNFSVLKEKYCMAVFYVFRDEIDDNYGYDDEDYDDDDDFDDDDDDDDHKPIDFNFKN